MNLSETNVFKLKYFNTLSHHLGSVLTTEKLKGGHEGEKSVTIFRYS